MKTVALLALLLVRPALAAEPQDRVAVLTPRGIVLLEGGESRLVPGTKGVDTFCWDRDGAHLLVTRLDRIDRVAISDGEAIRVAHGFRNVRFPSVSPDGAHVAFASVGPDGPQDWRVTVLRRRGRILEVGRGYAPAWTADGSKLVFEAYEDGPDLWVLDPVKKETKRAFEVPAHRYTPACGPGGLLAWSQRRGLELRDAQGKVRRITSGDHYDRFASFAPNGRSLVFVRQFPRTGRSAAIRLDLAEKKETVLLEGDVTLALCAPAAPKRRDLETFRSLSRRNVALESVESLTRVSPERHRFLHLWIKRGIDGPPHDEPLFLGGVRELTPEEAKTVASWKGSRIFLPGLLEITPDVAKELARYGGELWLDGLLRLDAATARILAEDRKRTLRLDSLREPSAEVLEALVACRGSLSLGGITSLDPATAEILARWKGWGEAVLLRLDEVGTMTPEAARKLSAVEGWGLSLDGLAELTPELARALVPLDVPFLSLGGLRTLDLETARVMSTWNQKFLYLDGIETLAPEVRAEIEKGTDALSLDRLSEKK